MACLINLKAALEVSLLKWKPNDENCGTRVDCDVRNPLFHATLNDEWLPEGSRWMLLKFASGLALFFIIKKKLFT